MRQISEYVDRLPYTGSGEDAHGNETKTWGPAEQVGIYVFDPGSTSEPRLPGHDRVVVEPTIYGPLGLPFEPHDRCVARGATYEIDGATRDWERPNGTTSSSVVSLRKVDG